MNQTTTENTTTKSVSLVYIHIGIPLPTFLYDSLYQTLLINEYKTKLYVVIDDSLVNEFKTQISKFNHNLYTKSEFYFKNLIEIVPLSILDIRLSDDSNFNDYKTTISTKFGSLAQFRGGFWISTTARFYYISELMRIFELENVFHIENDIMIYDSLPNLYEYLTEHLELNKIDKICMVQDAPNRVVPSILFFPNYNSISELTQYITNELKFSENFINDMDILGSYPNKYTLPVVPIAKNNTKKSKSIIFDGAAIGQYLGGVDYKNLENSDNKIIQYNNPSRGFINETSVMKPNDYIFSQSKVTFDHLNIPININICRDPNKADLNQIANLHIHSKQLYQFSSVFNIQYNDIITGDRILSLCDFVILTKDIYNFHSGIIKYARDIILIKNFNDINIPLLNTYFTNKCKESNTTTVKLFIYTHILQEFTNKILPYLDESIKYTLYIHNSDHAFDNNFKIILNSSKIKRVYAQNIDVDEPVSEKLTLLPIGIANSMWKHGNLEEFYTVMQETYKNNKNNSIYVNINPNTYDYRKNILDKIKEKNNFDLSLGKTYIEYLRELASYRFCLCIRGNGIDTHRFWESLYLGVIPVIINNKTTKCTNFIQYLKQLDVPFYEIKNDNLDMMFTKYDNNYFNEKLYKKFLQSCNSSLFNINSLKIKHYL